jgi:hypothetical protein
VGFVHLVFISAGDEERWIDTIKAFQKTAVLTVGESDKFLQTGGIISFTREADKVRFEVNQDSMEDAGLKINAQLLKLATAVRRKPKGL